MRVVIAALTLSVCLTSQTSTAIRPLRNAHAHNDYLHERPLFDALSHGFCSVEADVFLVEDELQIGHSRSQLKKGRTLQKLYLDPLRQRIKRNSGTVFKNHEAPFTLLIDLKTDGNETFPVLDNILGEYAEILTKVEDGKLQRGPVTVIISGNRPMELIAESQPRYCGIDGRLSDLETDKPAHLMPLISDNFRNQFTWRGDGPIPAAEREKLRSAVTKAHATGRRVRFWATPENEDVWEELQAAKVDLLNTDQLQRLQTFLQKQ